MKLFIDTNIFLDILFKRENHISSLKILDAVLYGYFDGTILDITILNIDYIAKKQTKNLNGFLNLIVDNFNIVGANNLELKQALALKHNDLEDSLQYICAKKVGCNLIITNDKKFIKKDIKVLSSLEFIEQIKSK
jgi:predicted nucleic acid-binding protein